MSILTKIENELAADAKIIFSDAEKATLAFFDTLITQAETALPQTLKDIITNAVHAAETTGGNGSDKFAAAWAAVVETATNEGLPVIENIIRAAIEAAVATLKAS